MQHRRGKMLVKKECNGLDFVYQTLGRKDEERRPKKSQIYSRCFTPCIPNIRKKKLQVYYGRAREEERKEQKTKSQR